LTIVKKVKLKKKVVKVKKKVAMKTKVLYAQKCMPMVLKRSSTTVIIKWTTRKLIMLQKEMIALNKKIIALDTDIETHEIIAAKTTPEKQRMTKSNIIAAKNAVSQSPIKAVNPVVSTVEKPSLVLPANYIRSFDLGLTPTPPDVNINADKQDVSNQGWNRPAFCNNGDDDDEDCTIAVTPDFPITDSLIMENEHLDTIPKTESDKFIKSSSSVENLVPIPSESEDFSDIESECDMPDCDDSQTTKFSTFSNPLFDDSTSSDDESSHEEVIHKISFKTYSNPLFDLDEEIISSEFNPIHNEDLDSTPKNVRFDTKSYLLESLLNRDESISLGIDSDDSDSEGDTLSLERLLHDDPIPLPDTLDFSYDVQVFLPFLTYPVTSSILLSSGSEDIIFDPTSIISLL
nr:hypothetical protein [Tanacetum cinerariifolium]